MAKGKRRHKAGPKPIEKAEPVAVRKVLITVFDDASKKIDWEPAGISRDEMYGILAACLRGLE